MRGSDNTELWMENGLTRQGSKVADKLMPLAMEMVWRCGDIDVLKTVISEAWYQTHVLHSLDIKEGKALLEWEP